MSLKVDGKEYKLLVMLVGMLCASSALAVSYSIPADYRRDPSGLCQTVRKALAVGMVLDAKRPLCERRFQLSQRAERLGLSSVEKALLPSSTYPGMLRKMFSISGQEHMPQSPTNRINDEAAIRRIMKNGDDTRIWEAHFDADNSGKVQKTYLMEDTSCEIKDYGNNNFTVFIEKSDGNLDPAWGAYTTGIPFFLKGHTYYVKWTSMRGSMVKNDLAELDIYDSGPFDPTHGSHAGFGPPICEIHQKK